MLFELGWEWSSQFIYICKRLIMKNYILWVITGIILLIILYFGFWEKLLKNNTTIQNEWSIVWSWIVEDTNSLTWSELIDEDDFMQTFYQWLKNSTIEDITVDQKWERYNNYSPYLLGEMGRIYTIPSWWMVWILHNNILLYSDREWWLPWFTIHDTYKDSTVCHRWNKPTWLIQSGSTLLMSVIDRCGGWSGDWYVSAYELKENKKRELASCYNYDNWSMFENNTPEEYKDLWHYRGSWQLDKLNPAPLEECQWNIQIQYYM